MEKKYQKKREGCTTLTVTVCGASLAILAEIQMKHRIATGRHLTFQQAFNYAMNDYNNLRNK